MKAQVIREKKVSETVRMKVTKDKDGNKEQWTMVAGRWKKVA